MTTIVPMVRSHIANLKARSPSGIVTLVVVALGGGLTATFRWVAQQQNLDARTPEFIGLLLLAGILYVIGVFWVERYRLGIMALLIILGGAVLFRVTLLPSPST